MPLLEKLEKSSIYFWTDYARAFGFREGRFRFAQGILITKKTGTCLLTTYPDGGQHIDYGDQWKDGCLEYRGEGLVGDQKMTGNNRAIAENRYELHVAENVGPTSLRYLGRFQCVKVSLEKGADSKGKERREFRFLLRASSD